MRNTKKKLVEDYFNNSQLLIKKIDLCSRFLLSDSYFYKLIKQLLQEKKITKTKGKIIYYKSNELK